MLKAVRAALETYATGMGLPAADVIREFKALPEAQKFDVLARIKELEKAHQEWVENGEKPPEPPPPPPESDSERAARAAREEYLRTGRNPLASTLVDRHGRPAWRGRR